MIDNTEVITCFVPSNAAFAKPNAKDSYASSSSLLSGHIIPDFAGYLPELKNGTTFKTQSGTSVTVIVKGGDYYINNAKIIASNQIVDNGVVHVLDSVGLHQLFVLVVNETNLGSSRLLLPQLKLLFLSLRLLHH